MDVLDNHKDKLNNGTPLVSIYTCVYNMEDRIDRNLLSVENLDYKNIEHIIVDDGSMDNVLVKIKEYMYRVNYPVKYIRKENGGKHTATNIAWDYVSGEFQIQLDADDSIKNNAISFLIDEWNEIPNTVKSLYWCVHGRSEDQYGNFDGDYYPDNYNELEMKGEPIKEHIRGNKLGLQKVSLINGLRYPEPVGVKHVSEDIVFVQMNIKYKTWVTNEIVHVYWKNQEGNNLTDKPKTPQQFANKAFSAKWKVINHKKYKFNYWLEFMKYGIGYFKSTKYFRENNRYLEGFNNYDKTLLIILSPFFLIGSKIYR